MTHRHIKIGATTVVLVLRLRRPAVVHAARGHRVLQARRRSDDRARQAWQGKQLQLHGYVVAKSILVKPDTLEYRFKVQNNGNVVDAHATPASCPTRSRTPAEAEVVLKGTLTTDGFHVEPNGVMAKCPSKYEAAAAAGA